VIYQLKKDGTFEYSLTAGKKGNFVPAPYGEKTKNESRREKRTRQERKQGVNSSTSLGKDENHLEGSIGLATDDTPPWGFTEKGGSTTT